MSTFFKQDLGQFLSSKTNWAATISICAALYAFTNNWITYGELMQAVSTGTIAFGFRDAVAK